jgi:hypothetical protein
MDARSRAAFLALIAAQAAHSVEEWTFRLFDVFTPARLVSRLFSDDPSRGFAIGNAVIVLGGLVCYAAIVRPDRPSARGVAWFWALLELGNGIGHTVFALSRGSYFPGIATAPLLLALSAYLIFGLTGRADGSHPARVS